MTPEIHTFQDAMEAMEDFAQALSVGVNQAQMRRAIEEAYREVMASHDWTFLHTTGRVLLEAPQATGTVVFDYTGGANERELTLTGATWPEDVVNWSVRFGDVVSDVEERVSDTVVTLDALMCPLEDVAATTYSAFPRWYILPADFAAMDHPTDSAIAWQLGRVRSIAEIHDLLTNEDQTGAIDYYAVGPAPDLVGSQALYVWPPADTTRVLTFPYKRRARRLAYSGKDVAVDAAGTITVTAGSAAVAGSGTAFDADMVGSILRIGKSTSHPPTGKAGGYRYSEERVVASVASTDTLTLDAAVGTSRTAVRYTVSDAIDLEVAAYDALVACARRNVARDKSPKTLLVYEQAYQQALKMAKAADCRTTGPRYWGTPNTVRVRLADSTSREVID